VRWIASKPKKHREQAIRNLSDEEARRVKSEIEYDWWEDARPEQIPPEGDWRVWLLLAGRGFGKTRTGAEYVRAQIVARRARRIALVAPTALDVRSIMVEGESGLLSIGPPQERPEYEPSLHRLTWKNMALSRPCFRPTSRTVCAARSTTSPGATSLPPGATPRRGTC
jgi:phage terminase large subunit-like protein